ncbi:MAG: AAA family ATPase [Rhodobacteraceae bacterium]|nr:AAA family ATPase [Paracoccaceae bacterium]
MTAPSEIDRARAALRACDPSVGRTDWCRVGMAAKAAGLDLQDFTEWSRGAANFKDDRDCADAWRSFRPDGGVTAATLFALARSAGWVEERASARPTQRERWNTPARLWADGVPAAPDHEYIRRKWGLTDGLRMIAGPMEGWGPFRGRNLQGWLVVPAYDPRGALQSVQLVGPAKGEKLNAPGASLTGATFTLGQMTPGGVAYIVEGLAHAWTCHHLTGAPAVVTFGKAGLSRAAQASRAAGARPVVVADRGAEAEAEAAARAAGGGWVALPDDLPNGADVNDLHQSQGQDAALSAIGAVQWVEGDRTSTGPLFFPASDFAGVPVPPRAWLVPDLVPMGKVTLLGGDGGTGKSLLALQLAVAVAIGRTWIGRETRSGSALFLSAEDDRAELHRRLADVVASEAIDFGDLGNLHVSSLAGEDALLTHIDRASGLIMPAPKYEEIDATMAATRPALVVLDTLADLFPGNENDRAQARQFIGLLSGLALRHGAAVVLLAHPSLSGLTSGRGTSGSTAWNNSVRSRLYLERVTTAEDGATIEPDPDARILRGMKANYAPAGAEIALTWRDGVFVAAAGESGLDRMAKTAKAERVFLRLLQEFTDEGRRVTVSTGHGYAPTIFAKSGRAEGCTKAALAAAMESLFARKVLTLGQEGPPSRRVNFIVRASEGV